MGTVSLLPPEAILRGSVCRTQLSRLASMYHYRNE
jgi:hypothetical protein